MKRAEVKKVPYVIIANVAVCSEYRIVASVAASALQSETPPTRTATGLTSKMKISDELMNPLPWSTDTLDTRIHALRTACNLHLEQSGFIIPVPATLRLAAAGLPAGCVEDRSIHSDCAEQEEDGPADQGSANTSGDGVMQCSRA